jgi:hypothetical protein
MLEMKAVQDDKHVYCLIIVHHRTLSSPSPAEARRARAVLWGFERDASPPGFDGGVVPRDVDSGEFQLRGSLAGGQWGCHPEEA